MSISNQELLRKATLTTADFGGSNAPLKIEAADRFITLMTIGQQILNDVQVVRHTASKWQQATVQFASRIMRPGVQATRLADVDRAKPSTGLIEMSTALVKGEVVAADEVFEDNLEGDSFAQTLETLIADRAGFDLEELALQGDTSSGDPYLALLDGWLKQARSAGGHVLNASTLGQDYQTIFRRLLLSLPERAKRNIETDGRYYVPTRMEQMYRDALSSRGTPLGDLTLTGNNELRYQGILIKGVATMPIVAGGTDTAQILLTNKNNLYAGFRRQVTIESFRDPREGATSFIVTCRFDAKMADKDASATATNVDVTVN
jgi:HK97 family phage major capsid protein